MRRSINIFVSAAMMLTLGACAELDRKIDVALYGSEEEAHLVHEKYEIERNEREAEKQRKMEKEAFKLINEERKKNKVNVRFWSAPMQTAAQMRVREIIRKYSITRPDGRHYVTIFEDVAELKASDPIPSKELRARGFSTAESVVKHWMLDAESRRQLLNPRLSNFAVGVINKNGSNYWVFISTQ